MLNLKLIRTAATEFATYGTLLVDGIPTLVTLERTWLHNEKDISCVPSGMYVCERITSQKHGITLEVQHVPGRTGILFHVGNLPKDTHGCILLGYRYGVFQEGQGIMQSAEAMKEFRAKILSESEYTLGIINAF